MPAFETAPLLTVILILTVIAVPAQGKAPTGYQVSSAAAVASSRALAWLASNQATNGSYGPYSEVGTAPAAYALWLNNSQSLKARASFTWLASEFDDGTSGIWYEADIPGEVLYTLSASRNLGLLVQPQLGYDRLLALQGSNGGFKGFSQPPNYEPETSSVDTAMVLLGLVNASGMSSDTRQSALNYLARLQNQDGSFNLTSSLRSNSFYSLGPEPAALTALVTLAFKTSGYSQSSLIVSKALDYLSREAASNFTGHVYAASLSALAFSAFERAVDGSRAITYLVSSQSSDGSFRDVVRFSTSPNPLDTGWAAVALQLVRTESQQAGSLDETLLLNSPLIVILIAGVGVVVVAGLVFHIRRRKVSAVPAVQLVQ